MKIKTYMQHLGLLAAMQLSFGSVASWAEETPAVPAVEQLTNVAETEEVTKTLAKSGQPAEKLVLNEIKQQFKTISYGKLSEWHIQRTHNTAAKITVIVAPRALQFKSVLNGKVIKGEKLAKITGNTSIDPDQKYVATACQGCQKGRVLVESCKTPGYFSVKLNFEDLPALAEGKTQDFVLTAQQKKVGSLAYKFELVTAESDVIVKQKSRQADRYNDLISFNLLASNSKKGSKASERLEGKDNSERADKESKRSKRDKECLADDKNSELVDLNNDGKIDELDKKVAENNDLDNKSSRKQKRKDLPRYCLDQEQPLMTDGGLDNDDGSNPDTSVPAVESDDDKVLAAFESEHQRFVQDHLLK